MEQNVLVVAWFRYAAFADLDAFSRGQHHVHHSNLLQFRKPAARLIAQTRPLAQTGQHIPEHIRQEAHQDVGLDSVLFLMPNRSETEIAFMNPKRGFRFRELNVGSPEFLIGPIGHIGSEQITARAQGGPISGSFAFCPRQACSALSGRGTHVETGQATVDGGIQTGLESGEDQDPADWWKRGNDENDQYDGENEPK